MDRRHVLGAFSTATLTATAGCMNWVIGSANGNPDPHIDSELLADGGWVQFDSEQVSETETVSAGGFSQDIDITGRTDFYEDEPLRHRVRDDTLGELDTTLRLLFTTKLGLDPDPSSIPGVGSNTILDAFEPEIEETFQNQLSDMGLTNITHQSESTLTVDTGEDARFHTYEGTYPYGPIPFDVGGDAAVEIPEGEVSFEAMYAMWAADDYILVAGGGYPTEDVFETVDEDVTGAISVDITIDLPLYDDDNAEEIRTLIKAVE